MQSIPLAVLKPETPAFRHGEEQLHAIHTACGIETRVLVFPLHVRPIACNPYRLRY